MFDLIFAPRRKILQPIVETFLLGASSIQMQLVTRLFAARSRRNPAVAAAGSMTRSLSGR
jgi:hypothetical protein